MKECKCYKHGYSDAKAESQHEITSLKCTIRKLRKKVNVVIDDVLKPLPYPQYKPTHGDGYYVVFLANNAVTSTWAVKNGLFDCKVEFMFIDINISKLMKVEK